MGKTKSKKPSGSTPRSGIVFRFGVFGGTPKSVKVRKGYSLGQLRTKMALKGQRITVNGDIMEDTYTFRSGDEVLAVPQVKGGFRS